MNFRAESSNDSLKEDEHFSWYVGRDAVRARATAAEKEARGHKVFSPRDSSNINNPESSLNKGKFSRNEDKSAVYKDSSVVEEDSAISNFSSAVSNFSSASSRPRQPPRGDRLASAT